MDNKTEPFFNILSIDSGGVRGFSTLAMLESLEMCIIAKLKDLKHPHTSTFRLAHCFQLISGTSCGALLGCLLSDRKANRTVTEVIKIFKEKATEIFQRTLWHKIKTGWGLWGPVYDGSRLAHAIDSVVGQLRLSELYPPMLVPAFDLKAEQPKVFVGSTETLGTFKCSHTEDFYVRDILLAATAVPVFFPAHDMSSCPLSVQPYSSTLCDAGLFLNNPGVVALAMMKKHVPDMNRIRLVSFGTGTGKKPMNYYAWMKNAGWLSATWVLVALLFFGQEGAIAGAVAGGLLGTAIEL